MEEAQTPSIADCLKLLKGERDEQRLAGLLLVTKVCKRDDLSSLRAVYDTVDVRFLDRLFKTGMGKGPATGSGVDNRDAYLQLTVTIVAAFCRVPEIAASEYMVAKIPMILKIMTESDAPILEECCEILYLVATSSEDGVSVFYESDGLKVIASRMHTIPDGSHTVELLIKMLRHILSKLPQDFITSNHLSDLATVVESLGRQFGLLHSPLKFEALHLLSQIFSSKYSEPLCGTLRAMGDNNWSDYIHIGVVDILQNRVAPTDKVHALTLAESMLSISGEEWLLRQPKLTDRQVPLPIDRCLLLVLESARVEVAVLLNELAYLKYEASKSALCEDTIPSKQQNITIVFSLIEKIIKLISGMAEDEGSVIDESTIINMINGLNETATVVLEYLQDAREHGEKKGNDLLASVRLLGSYLAETPNALKEKVEGLLEYMLSVEGEDETSPFYSLCFLLPMLCQMTMEVQGCKTLISSGCHKTVVEFLIRLIHSHREDVDRIFLACDTVMNLLLKQEKIHVRMEEATCINLLNALSYWAEESNDQSVLMMAASMCALVLDSTSEVALLNHPNFDVRSLSRLCQLISRSLALSKKGMEDDDVKAQMDLIEIVTAGFSRWSNRFPSLKEAALEEA
ncbi:ncdn [Linum grandiflorum]